MRRRELLATCGGIATTGIAGCLGFVTGGGGSCSPPSTDDLASLLPKSDRFQRRMTLSSGFDVGTDEYVVGAYEGPDGRRHDVLIANYESGSAAEENRERAVALGEWDTGSLVTGSYLVVVDAHGEGKGRDLLGASDSLGGCSGRLSFGSGDGGSTTAGGDDGTTTGGDGGTTAGGDDTTDGAVTGAGRRVDAFGFEDGDAGAWRKKGWANNGLELTDSVVRSGQFAGKVPGQGTGFRSIDPVTEDGAVVPFSVRVTDASNPVNVTCKSDRRNRNNVLAKVRIEGGRIAYSDGGETTAIGPAESGRWYDVAVRLNFTDQTYAVDVGRTGEYDVTGAAFDTTSRRVEEFSRPFVFASSGTTAFVDAPPAGGDGAGSGETGSGTDGETTATTTVEQEPVVASVRDGWEDGDYQEDPVWFTETDAGIGGNNKAEIAVVDASAPDGGSKVLQYTLNNGSGVLSTGRKLRFDAPWTIDGLVRFPAPIRSGFFAVRFGPGGSGMFGAAADLSMNVNVTEGSESSRRFEAQIGGDLTERTNAISGLMEADTWYRYRIRHEGDGTYRLEFGAAGAPEGEADVATSTGDPPETGPDTKYPLRIRGQQRASRDTLIQTAYVHYRTDAAER